MSDVSSYEFKYLTERVEALEKENLRKLKEQAERDRRKTDQMMQWTTFFLILVFAISMTIIITKAIVEKN